MTIPLDSARAYAMVAVSRGVMVTPAHKQVIFGKFPMLTFFIVSGILLYIFIAWLFCVVFVTFLEPDITDTWRQYNKQYNVRMKISKKKLNISEPGWRENGSFNECDYPYKRAILWPLTLFVWFIEFCILDKITESLQNYVDEQTKKVEEKKKVKKTAEDYLNGKGEL